MGPTHIFIFAAEGPVSGGIFQMKLSGCGPGNFSESESLAMAPLALGRLIPVLI
jgi:hypothetical protein